MIIFLINFAQAFPLRTKIAVLNGIKAYIEKVEVCKN